MLIANKRCAVSVLNMQSAAESMFGPATIARVEFDKHSGILVLETPLITTKVINVKDWPNLGTFWDEIVQEHLRRLPR